MKLVFGTAFSFILIATEPSRADAGPASKSKMRFADAGTEACLKSGSTENGGCKRVRPTSFSTPCLNSCDGSNADMLGGLCADGP